MNFNEKVNFFYNVVQEKIANEDMDVVVKLISGFLDIVEKQYPNEFYSLLDKTGVKKDLEIWTKYSMQFISKIDGLEIDPWKNIVILELEGEVLSSPLYNIKEYLDNLKNITVEEKFLIASFLGKSQNSKIVQVYHNFIK